MKENTLPSSVSIIEAAHQKDLFMSKKNVAFDIQLFFGGSERLNGRIILSADSKNGKIENGDGTVILFNNDTVFCSPEIENLGSARFAAYTWSYFFMFPYKLSDGGTQWNDYENGQLGELDYDAQKLTFTAGTGDAPEDWYIMYSDPESHLINTAAYIVTAGGTIEEAEEDPHAIEYCDYKQVDGIPVSTTWRFWEWRTDKGLTKQLGNATISNMEFLTVSEEFYSPLANYQNVSKDNLTH